MVFTVGVIPQKRYQGGEIESYEAPEVDCLRNNTALLPPP